MPFCHECGKPVSAKAKFCRECGASQADALPDETVPAPGAVPAPEIPPATPVPVADPAPLTCPSCGSVIGPDEKFCGSCGAKIGSVPPPAPVPAPISTPPPIFCPACGMSNPSGMKFCGSCGAPIGGQAPPPPPPPAMSSVAADSAGPRLCTACGNPIQPGDKYCSKCLVMVKDPAPPAVTHVVPVAAPAQSSGTYVCASCGSPLNGNEKFCGVCGATAVAAAMTANSGPAAMVCASCGAPITATTKFCGRCGAPVGASFPSGQVTAQPTGETVRGIIPHTRKMKMMGLGADTYTVIVTDRRMILARLTQAMMNTAITEAQAKARAEGKGFFGAWADQLAASFGFAKKYETMPPDAALAETPGNFALENSRIRLIKVSEVRSNDDDATSHDLRLEIDSADGSFAYVISEDDRFTTLLQNVYGDRVKMPFGLFKAGPVRIKFF